MSTAIYCMTVLNHILHVKDCYNSVRGILTLSAQVRILQWIWQVSFPRLVHINMSASYSLFPVLFLPSSCNKTFERAHQLIHSEKKITRSSCHRAFLCSPDLERICIHANWLSLVRDLPMLHIVLEAAIPVSCFHSTGQTCPCALRMSRYVASITFTQPHLPDWAHCNYHHLSSLYLSLGMIWAS